jgi:GNAT superfamily N-acetyltransferase
MQLQPNLANRQAREDSETLREVVIRPADPDDAGPAVELIYLPMGRLADYLFGANDPERAREVLGKLFLFERDRFSFQYCDVLELNGAVVGLLLSYPARILKRLALPMGRHLLAIYGWKEMVHFVERSRPLMGVNETETDEYYVYTLAIGNERARQFYERCGYETVETVRISALEETIGYAGYYRMLKQLSHD